MVNLNEMVCDPKRQSEWEHVSRLIIDMKAGIEARFTGLSDIPANAVHGEKNDLAGMRIRTTQWILLYNCTC
jgi:hypothetical protein